MATFSTNTTIKANGFLTFETAGLFQVAVTEATVYTVPADHYAEVTIIHMSVTGGSAGPTILRFNTTNTLSCAPGATVINAGCFLDSGSLVGGTARYMMSAGDTIKMRVESGSSTVAYLIYATEFTNSP